MFPVQALNHIRVMKVLMDAVHMFHPQPKIAPEMIKFLGKCHASWHIGIAMLESHLLISPDEPRHFHALTDLCKAAHEQDLAYGIWKARCVASCCPYLLRRCCALPMLHDQTLHIRLNTLLPFSGVNLYAALPSGA